MSQMLNVDVWVLHDESMGHEVAKQVNDLAASNGRVFVAKTPLIDLDRYPPFQESERKDLIWPFINWLNQSKYAFAWYVEDDFVFTGDWSSYFGAAEQEAGRADLVAKYRETNAWWSLAESCKLRGRKCLQNNHIVQTQLALHRMSRRFAARMLHLRALRQLQGRDEALVAVICDEWVECARSPLYFQGGVYQPGHWGPFQSNFSARPYTLRGLASFNAVTSKFDFSKYSTNADVPRDRLYHPVKCEAERQWEGKSLVDKIAPRLSLLAPELSSGKGFGNAGGHKDRYRLQSEGPKTTARKDTAHGDLQESETAWHLKKSASLYASGGKGFENAGGHKDRDRLQGDGPKPTTRKDTAHGDLQESELKWGASVYKERLNEKRARDALQGEKEGGREGERKEGSYMSQFKKSASLYKESLREK